MAATTEGRFRIPSASTDVSWILSDPDDAIAVIVLGHGAGADMRHASMASIATELSRRRVAVLRFNFPFMEGARRLVDSRAVSAATIANAVVHARNLKPALSVFLGGHSFGGRMASHAVLEHDLGAVRGLVFCSFPLHPPGKPATTRADHLDAIDMPMLFLSGTRDALAQSDLLDAVIDRLGARAELVWLDTADHGYKVQKRGRARSDSVFEALADAAVSFVRRLC